MPGLWIVQAAGSRFANRRRTDLAVHVAPGTAHRAVGPVTANDRKEAAYLKLSASQIPLPISLRQLVLRKYADPDHPRQFGQEMEREELLGYLKNYENTALAPLEAVLAQTEIIGDPALPTDADCAALRWAGAAFDLWEETFPLEDELAAQMRKLKPSVAIAAVFDTDFYTPGAHPLHRIFDALHKAATGWQDNLGRAGQPVRTLVEETVEEVAAMIFDRRKELVGLARSVVESAQRNQSRADRMATRAVETELGRLRSAQARVSAAQMINEGLARYPAPPDIGRFLRGPWYDSAQLVFLKFGEDSEQWRSMSATTGNLLESLQPPDEQHESRRQQLFESVSGIPTEVKRWLLSMQHDSDAVEQIMSEIEYAHLRIMRNQPATLENIPPIDLGDLKPPRPDTQVALPDVRKGQWFLIRTRKGDLIRVQVTMVDQEYQQLLFCNQAGIKVQTLDFANFNKLIENATAQHLDSDATFSRSLTVAAGIESDEVLLRLTSDREPGKNAQAAASPPPTGAAVEDGSPDSPLRVDPVEPTAPELPDEGLPDLPMGTWLGFHDVDPPLLAKLALHDKVRRLLIFVNRKGLEQRRLEEDEYLRLIREGLVDIMEATNNFREQVERARQRMQNHQK